MTKRWPDKEGWDAMAEVMETLAEACGARVFCSRKYDYLRVEIQDPAGTAAQNRALAFVADMIEQISDREGAGRG